MRPTIAAIVVLVFSVGVLDAQTPPLTLEVVSVGVPVINQHNGVQSKPDYRILTGIGARLN
jgi:hypothetical protein